MGPDPRGVPGFPGGRRSVIIILDGFRADRQLNPASHSLIIRAAGRFKGLGLVGGFSSTAHTGSRRAGGSFPWSHA